jgi:hypothetical protein
VAIDVNSGAINKTIFSPFLAWRVDDIAEFLKRGNDNHGDRCAGRVRGLDATMHGLLTCFCELKTLKRMKTHFVFVMRPPTSS